MAMAQSGSEQGSSEQTASRTAEKRPGRRRVAPPRLSGRSAYSLFVSAMKVLLPAVAVGLVLLIAIWPQIERTGGFRLDAVETFGDTPVPEEATMVNPRYEGIDENRRPFMITADIARQIDPGEEETIDMQQPAADLFDDVGKWLAITADHGVYERGQEVLLLDGNVNIFHDDGYELQTDQAVVDLAADLATSSLPTFGQGSFGTIKSEGLRVEERGDRVFFTGRAHLVLYPSDEGVQSAPNAGAPDDAGSYGDGVRSQGDDAGSQESAP